ncbi:mitochondrial protein Pet127-domain-containing protein [Pisolithus marmoratus]|nr:mitochondrial protein Pet127-domain-containing protein [Pisolithus marmoratus]
MKVLGNGFPLRRVARWRVVQTFRNPSPMHAFRSICRSVTTVSSRTIASVCPGGSLMTRLSAHSPPPLAGFEIKQSYKAKAPGAHTKPRGEAKRQKRRSRKPKVYQVARFHMQRREALRSALLRNLQAGSRIDSKFQSVTSTPRRSDPHGMTGDTEQASSTFERGGSIDQEGSGFKPEEWSTGWGSDGLAPPATLQHAPTAAKRRLPPHIQAQIYSRRTEGFLHNEPRVGSQGSTNYLQDVKSPSEHKPIAQLAHGLSRVLFNPGVHWLQDPRSRVYNFTPWLEAIPKVNDFAFERVTGFVRSSQDNDLHILAKRHNRPFVGSTSSLTGLLSHVYFLVSGDRAVDTSPLSRAFAHESTTFTPGQRMPTSVILNYNDGVWSIDSDKANVIAEKNVLTWMGTMLEKFLVLPEPEFKKLLRSSPQPLDDHDSRKEAYRYAMSDSFVMRSQLDCVDSRLPGTGVFDIKTRAAVPIRLDILNYEENSGYLIKKLTGAMESFEKEYYDLIRSAFLKYSFQARIGNMDGVLVAYHNTARIFGFQYVPLEEMEARLYGPGDGSRVFNKCLRLLECILKEVVGVYGQQSVRCTFDKRDHVDEMVVFVEPASCVEGSEGKLCPITQLEVKVENHLNDVPVRGSTAVASDQPWLIHWVISHSAADGVDIRGNLSQSQSRQLTALHFPTGVTTQSEMVAHWDNIHFGDPMWKSSDEGPSTASSNTNVNEDRTEGDELHSLKRSLAFRTAPPQIEYLRRLAREGHDATMRAEAEEASSGRGKSVWGPADCLGDVLDGQNGQLVGDVSEPTGDSGEVGGVSVSVEESCASATGVGEGEVSDAGPIPERPDTATEMQDPEPSVTSKEANVRNITH